MNRWIAPGAQTGAESLFGCCAQSIGSFSRVLFLLWLGQSAGIIGREVELLYGHPVCTFWTAAISVCSTGKGASLYWAGVSQFNKQP